jgi:hypothetical protein
MSIRTGLLVLLLVAANSPLTASTVRAATQIRYEGRLPGYGIAPTQDSSQLVGAARRWLALVDSGRYATSFDSAAPLLRQMAGTADGWGKFVGQARTKFPPNPGSSRVVVRVDLAYSPEGAPPGRYVRVDFRVVAAGVTVPEFVVLQEMPAGWLVAMYGTTGR